MKIPSALLLALCAIGCASNAKPTPKSPATVKGDDSIAAPEEAPSEFDGDLAARLQADEYGMAQYVIAFLKAGPNREQNEEEAMRLQRAHLDNIGRLADEGKLVLAGPFMDEGIVRGIYVFDVSSIEEAKALTATDPAIEAGRLSMELRPWYGSAGLRDLNRIHKSISKSQP